MAGLHEARGESMLAAHHYRPAAEFARTHEGLDDDAINDFLGSVNRHDSSRARGAS